MVTAIYDGNCVLCNQTRQLIGLLDWFKRVEFVDLQQPATFKRYPTLDYNAAMGAMHLITPEHADMLAGFPAVRRMLREVPLGLPVWALLSLPFMDEVGARVYAFIAKHRYQINRWLGAPVCEDGACQVHRP